VVNRKRELGVVSGLREGPGGQWLEVRDGTMTLLIPLAEPYIDAIDLAAREVRVDWQEDW
jgi:16S rRNA processing protein RimM